MNYAQGAMQQPPIIYQQPPVGYQQSLQQGQVMGSAANTPYSTFREADSPTKLYNDRQPIIGTSTEFSPEKTVSPTKTDRMNTTGGLLRKNTLLASTTLNDEYKVANYGLAE